MAPALTRSLAVGAPLPSQFLGCSDGPRPDPAALPHSYRHNVDTTAPGEEVAVARTLGGNAFAFSSESYLHPHWERPGWDLLPGKWNLIVRVASSDATADQHLRFTVAKNGTLAWDPPLS